MIDCQTRGLLLLRKTLSLNSIDFLLFYMAETMKLPLHDFHAKHGARFVDFGGWDMPVQYSSILEEHTAVRTAAGLFDVSHMGEFHVYGKDAARFLDRLVVNSVENTPIGKAVYSPMCADDGGVVDDLILYRTEADAFLVCVNASNIEKDYAWFHKQAEAWQFDLHIDNHSSNYALLAVQGPLAEAVLEAVGFQDIRALKRFRHQDMDFGDETVRVCRTGYTGEDGFEIYTSLSAAAPLAEAILEKGTPMGLKLCGLGARDSLRLEAGLPLYGHELTDTITPLEASLDWTVKFDKAAFCGKQALEAQKTSGVPRRVAHFKLEGRRIAREGTPVLSATGDEVGRVLSGSLSPMIQRPIGSAIVATEAQAGPLFVDLRGHKLQLEIARPPLHK